MYTKYHSCLFIGVTFCSNYIDAREDEKACVIRRSLGSIFVWFNELKFLWFKNYYGIVTIPLSFENSLRCKQPCLLFNYNAACLKIGLELNVFLYSNCGNLCVKTKRNTTLGIFKMSSTHKKIFNNGDFPSLLLCFIRTKVDTAFFWQCCYDVVHYSKLRQVA